MVDLKMDGKDTPVKHNFDLVEDITMEQVNMYGLVIVPYFFDEDTANRQGLEYFYMGIRK